MRIFWKEFKPFFQLLHGFHFDFKFVNCKGLFDYKLQHVDVSCTSVFDSERKKIGESDSGVLTSATAE